MKVNLQIIKKEELASKQSKMANLYLVKRQHSASKSYNTNLPCVVPSSQTK